MKKNEKWFLRFSITRSEKKGKNHQIHMIGFHCVARNIEGSLKICALFLVYSQIWLNLLRDDSHFFCIFLWMVTTLATNQNS